MKNQIYIKNNEKTSNLSTFEKAELEERRKITDLCEQINNLTLHITTPIDSKKNYDFIAISGNTDSTEPGSICLIGEVKVRYCSPQKYSSTIIEQTKYQAILDKVKKSKEKHPNKDIRGYLVVFFSDNSAYGWEITGKEKEGQIMAEKTSVRFGDGNIIMKNVKYFSMKKGKKIR